MSNYHNRCVKTTDMLIFQKVTFLLYKSNYMPDKEAQFDISFTLASLQTVKNTVHEIMHWYWKKSFELKNLHIMESSWNRLLWRQLDYVWSSSCTQ